MRSETGATADGTSRQLVRAVISEAIGRGLSVRMRVTGMSMFPYIWPGEMITVRPLAHGEAPDIGAVLVVDRGPEVEYMAHRLVEREGSRIVTRGDSVIRTDSPHSLVDVVGVVTLVEGRFTGRGRRIPLSGGVYWRALRACAPLSYQVNRFLAWGAVSLWRVVRVFVKKRGVEKR